MQPGVIYVGPGIHSYQPTKERSSFEVNVDITLSYENYNTVERSFQVDAIYDQQDPLKALIEKYAAMKDWLGDQKLTAMTVMRIGIKIHETIENDTFCAGIFDVSTSVPIEEAVIDGGIHWKQMAQLVTAAFNRLLARFRIYWPNQVDIFEYTDDEEGEI